MSCEQDWDGGVRNAARRVIETLGPRRRRQPRLLPRWRQRLLYRLSAPGTQAAVPGGLEAFRAHGTAVPRVPIDRFDGHSVLNRRAANGVTVAFARRQAVAARRL